MLKSDKGNKNMIDSGSPFFPIKSFFLAVKVTGKKQKSKNQTE